MPSQTPHVGNRVRSTSTATLTALLLLALLLPLTPAAAAVKTRTLTPSGWPMALTLPGAALLKVAGTAGVKAEDIDGDDFDLYNAAMEEADGEIYAVSGAHNALGAAASAHDPWAEFAKGYAAHLKSEAGTTVASVDLHAKFGGRRWLRFDVQRKEDDPDDMTAFSSFALLKDKTVYFVDIYYNLPPADDLDGQIAIILGGPNAAQ